MALPNIGNPISLSQVNTELGISPSTTQISLNDAAVRSLFAVVSGPISMYDGYGKSSVVAESGYHVSETVLTDTYSFGGPQVNSFTIDSENNTYSIGGGISSSFTIVKKNTNGAAIWAKKISLSGVTNFQHISPVDIKVDTSGNIYVIANAQINSDYYQQYNLGIVFKLTSALNVVWCKKIDSLGSPYGPKGWLLCSFDVNSSNGDVFLAGIANAVGVYGTSLPPNVLMAKLDSSGNLAWAKSQVVPLAFGYFGLRSDTYVCCKLDNSGNIYYSGADKSGSMIAALDSSGNFIWGPIANVGFGNIAMDTANGVFYSFNGSYLYKTYLSSGSVVKIASLSFKNAFAYSGSYNTYANLRYCNLKYDPSTGDLYYIYAGGHSRTSLGSGFWYVTKGNIANLNSLSWTKVFGANTISPAMSSGYPSLYTNQQRVNNFISNGDPQLTSGGNLVLGIGTVVGTASSPVQTWVYSGAVLKLPPDFTTVNTFNGNYGSYFTLDDPASPSANNDTSSIAGGGLTPSSFSNSAQTESSYLTVSGVSTGTFTDASVITTVTQFSANTNRVIAVPPVSANSAWYTTWYTGNRKYHIISHPTGSTAINASLNVTTVPSGKSWDWLIVGPGAVGSDGSGAGGNGGNGGAGGRVITGNSTATGNNGGIQIGSKDSGTSTVAFGFTASYAYNAGAAGGTSGSPNGGSTTNGTVSSITGASFVYGSGGAGGGVGQGIGYGSGGGGTTKMIVENNLNYASQTGIPNSANNGGNGGVWSQVGGVGGYNSNYQNNVYGGAFPWFAGQGGGGGGGGGDADPDDPESPGSAAGGYGGGSGGGMVILAYDYNP